MAKYIFIFNFLTIFILNSAHASESVGKITILRGKVHLVQSNGTKKEAKVGDNVQQSDSIEAGPASSARILMLDSNMIDVYPKSKVNIAKYIFKVSENEKKVELKVDFGKIKSTVNQKYDGEKNTFEVKTPTAVAGVRGTVFTVGYDPIKKASEIMTLKGLVAVSQFLEREKSFAAPVFVKPNQKIDVELKAANKPEVKDVSQEEIKKINQPIQEVPSEQNESPKERSESEIKSENLPDSTMKHSSLSDVQAMRAKQLEDEQAKRQKQLEELMKKREEMLKRQQEEAIRRAELEAAKRLEESLKDDANVGGSSSGGIGGSPGSPGGSSSGGLRQ